MHDRSRTCSASPADAGELVTLDDKYTLESGRVYVTGLQALVRLLLEQARRDRAAGLHTAGFVCGYRGSPLAGFDLQLLRARPYLEAAGVIFHDGINEELAATAVWGTQQLVLDAHATHDGVYALWYGKGPGVDRCGDVFKHGNVAGSAPRGGVLVVFGDDHGARSSTLPHQSEQALAAAMIPVVHPADLQDYLDFGLWGWAMSRYCGCWVGFKALEEIVDSSASMIVDPERPAIHVPEDFELPPDGLNLRRGGFAELLEWERRVVRYRLPAAQAFARANGLDRIAVDAPNASYGIVATGKAYLDVHEALAAMGIDERVAAALGLRIYKVGLCWPLDPVGAIRFAEGLDEVLVVEEKRGLVEDQLRAALYNLPAAARPVVCGKTDEQGRPLIPADDELDAGVVARVLMDRLSRQRPDRSALLARARPMVKFLSARSAHQLVEIRVPTYCSGCPHNTSTHVPEGSEALAGIGCHTMAVLMPERHTSNWSQMGGEGVSWIGRSPFTSTRHVFANLGDGTYQHSGLLAIRAAVAAGVDITYKILFNEAVAMTGGQAIEGGLTVARLTRQLTAEGVTRIVVVTDDPEAVRAQAHSSVDPREHSTAGLAPGVAVEHRSGLERLQRELREVRGVSVLIYHQPCAAELRRKRKRGTIADPDVHVFINEAVCEGCGDCNAVSSCVSVEPLETEHGRKRRINPSTCNKDETCIDGYCPSFVTVHGAQVRSHRIGSPPMRGSGARRMFEDLPEPRLAGIEGSYNILLTGVGGTGVTTIGALLGMAAHLEGRTVSVLDVTGLAQKNGAVTCHVRLFDDGARVHAKRLGKGNADLVLGCDMLVAAGAEALETIRCERERAGAGLTQGRPSTAVLLNADVTPPAAFQHDPDHDVGSERLREILRQRAGAANCELVHAGRLTEALMGDAIYTNIFMLGFGLQRGHVPLTHSSIERAIELNGVAVAENKEALAWGRLAAHDPLLVERAAKPMLPEDPPTESTLEQIVERRCMLLERYQNRAYAERYRAMVYRVASLAGAKAKGHVGLAETVARNYYKLLAYKDEYEVARLYSDGVFAAKIAAQFTSANGHRVRLRYHFAPQWLKADPASGRVCKRSFGPWMGYLLRILAMGKVLRGTVLDPFARLSDRRCERRLIDEYEATLDRLLIRLTPESYGLAIEIAALPEKIRGFGIVKRLAIEAATSRREELLAAFETPAHGQGAARLRAGSRSAGRRPEGAETTQRNPSERRRG